MCVEMVSCTVVGMASCNLDWTFSTLNNQRCFSFLFRVYRGNTAGTPRDGTPRPKVGRRSAAGWMAPKHAFMMRAGVQVITQVDPSECRGLTTGAAKPSTEHLVDGSENCRAKKIPPLSCDAFTTAKTVLWTPPTRYCNGETYC